jgi:hypothetical protein
VRAIAIAVVGVCASTTASRGEPAAAPPGVPPAAAPTATEPAPPPEADPAWRAYDDAFAQAAAGDRSGASARLRRLAAGWPLHPAAARAGALVREAEPRPAGPDAPDRVARGELVFWSTLGGLFTAENACVIADCSSPRATAVVYTLGVGGSLGLALAASRHGVAQGEAQLYNSAQTWGIWTGLGINNGFAHTGGEAAVAVGAQAGGLLAGVGLWQTWHPTQGDVALANSFLLWSTVLSLWADLAADHDPTLRETVVIGDAGLLLGGLISTRVKMSRGRTLLIDVGGVLGVLGGGLVAVGTRDANAAGVALLVGTAAGLGLAAAATRDWDAPPVAIAPARLSVPGAAPGTSVWGVSATLGF